MSLIVEHRAARKDKAKIVLHEFKIRFKKNSNIIYGFVEGKDDPSFYRGFIENTIPGDWSIDLWSVGGKDGVIEIYSCLDWRIFNKHQIVFFIDKDLSEFTEEATPKDINIYVTDNYSIENDIVNANTCDRVLREVCGISELSHEKSDKIKTQYIKQLELFQRSLIPVMSNIVVWRKNNMRANLNDIYMKHAFCITKGHLTKKSKPNGCDNLVKYIHTQCNLLVTNEKSASDIAIEFEKNQHYKRYTRGKYLLWFFVEFCLSIYRDYKNLGFVKIDNKPKMTTNLSQSNAIVLIAPRCRMPLSLKIFFENTIEKYVTLKVAI